MPGGGYALGSGNGVADYMLMERYLPVMDEGRSAGINNVSSLYLARALIDGILLL